MDKEEENKVVRKPDPSMRRNIQVATLNKIKSFLKEQENPVYKRDIVRQLRVDYNSLNLALIMIKHKTDDKGRIFVVGRKK